MGIEYCGSGRPELNEEPNDAVARLHIELPAAKSPRLWPHFMGFNKTIRPQDQGIQTIMGTSNPQYHCGDQRSY